VVMSTLFSSLQPAERRSLSWQFSWKTPTGFASVNRCVIAAVYSGWR